MFGYVARDAAEISDKRYSAILKAAGLRENSHRYSREAHAVFSAAASSSQSTTAGGLLVISFGAIHNRADLLGDLRLGSDTSESDLIRRAYEEWGAACCSRMFGDWCFAAWDSASRELFLARDHHGNTALYYQATTDGFAFSTSRHALLGLRLEPCKLDELYLAQVLISWSAYHGERTIHFPIKRLPPAHYLTVNPDRVEVRRYWRLEDVSELRLSGRSDYVEGFRAMFERAVRERLPKEGKAATTLSGGLDSGAVTATAARVLRDRGGRLTAYTSTLLADATPYVGGRFGEELPLAQATAQLAGNVDLIPIDAACTTPVQAIRTLLDITLEPQFAAGNLFWLLELYRTAAMQGHSVLLTGQMGNPGISWTGDISSQPIALQLRKIGLRGWARKRAKKILPDAVSKLIRRRHRSDWSRTAIAPEFAERLNLHELWLDDSMQVPNPSPLMQRLYMLRPGRSIGGGLHAEMGAAVGLTVTDPTADARVLEFCFSVPDWVFIDPETGMDRWLIREAMKDRLPDAVRLNRRRGRQAGDLVPRLRASAAEVEEALDECARGPATAYLDVAHMRRAWDTIRTEDTPDAFRLAVTVLTRGIMAGLFVNGFGKTW